MGNLQKIKVTVKIDGASNIFKIAPESDLNKLKKKIEKRTNIPVDDQELYNYKGEPLQDSLTLKSLENISENELYLYKKSELFEIKVSEKRNNYSHNEDEYFMIKVHENMEIHFIEMIYNSQFKHSCNDSLIFNNINLQSSRLVKDYDIKKGSHLIYYGSYSFRKG